MMKEAFEVNQPIICVDLDGTIAEYTGWKGHCNIGEPINEAINLLKILKNSNWKIIINTCRNNGMNGETNEELININERIHFWLKLNSVPYDYLATRDMGKPFAHVYLDDRALRWENNLGSLLIVCGKIQSGFTQLKKEVGSK